MSKKTKETRHREYLRYKASGKAYAWAAKSRDKTRGAINARQRDSRNKLRRRLLDRLDCDARRTIGKSTSDLTIKDMYVILNVRLFKLRKGGGINQIEAATMLEQFKDEPFATLLSTYQYRVTPNILGINQLSPQIRRYGECQPM